MNMKTGSAFIFRFCESFLTYESIISKTAFTSRYELFDLGYILLCQLHCIAFLRLSNEKKISLLFDAYFYSKSSPLFEIFFTSYVKLKVSYALRILLFHKVYLTLFNGSKELASHDLGEIALKFLR